nr:MAG TPA: hypothetical protein [Caudoviricetes sp.]DAX64713.1 MAG TPA: hypothetical protein [Caudoviricetes sp.]
MSFPCQPFHSTRQPFSGCFLSLKIPTKGGAL